MTKICSISECENKHYGLGYCLTHWYNFKKHGDPLKKTNPADTRKKQSQSAIKRIERDGIWNKNKTKDDHPSIKKQSETQTGMPKSSSHKANLSKAKKGKPSSIKGIPKSDVQKKKQSKSMKIHYKTNSVHNKGKTKKDYPPLDKMSKSLSKTKKKAVAEGTYKSPMQDKKHTDVAKKKNADKHRHPLSAKTIALLIKQRNTPEARKRLQEQYTKNPPPKTRNTSAEKDLRKLLESKKIIFIPQTESDPQKEFDLGFKSHRVDFFIEPNICLEADGDRSHVNPNPHKLHGRSHHLGYKADYVLYKRSDGTWLAKDQWELDRRETKALTKLGNNVLRFWQSELQNNPEECIQRIIEAMKFN